MAHNQKSRTNPTVKMDSRKFLGALNESAQAKVAFFTDKVQEMGRSAGRQWRLAALRTNDLFIEDVSNKTYYLADHQKSQGKISINNIRAVEIVEGEKAGLFEDSCLRLVNAIEENSQKDMAVAFNRMKAQRFSGRTVPTSGVVRTRDGVVRQVNVSNGVMESAVKNRLVAAICESLQDNVILENGHVEAAYFNDGQRFRLPVTKWASKKLIARNMREAAGKAYLSTGFQKRISAVANYIAESKIDKAVAEVQPFLEDKEEFTLLSKKQIHALVENALAACGIFNQQLCDDTATLFYRTNMKINRPTILREWKAIAKASENTALVENVMLLSESKNFETAYDRFLHLIFEAISNRDVAAESLATTLEVLKDKTPKIKESHELSSKLNGLIERLKSPDFDDAAIYEAEDLIATIQEELNANESLRDFDSMPGDKPAEMGGEDKSMDLGQDAISTGSGQQPVININSPLIQIGGTSGAGEGEGEEDFGDLDLEAPAPEAEEGADDEFGDLLDSGEDLGAPAAPAVGGQAPAAPAAGGQAPAAGPRLESRRRGNSIQESRPKNYERNRMVANKGKEEDDLSGADLEESFDPYSYRKSDVKAHLMMDYGAPAIKDDADLDKVVNLMQRLAEQHELSGQSLAENLDDMARACIEVVGLRLPGAQMESAVEQAVNFFIESEKPFPGAAAPFGKKDKHEDGEEDNDDESENPWEEEGVAEDQYKSPSQKKMGYGRASLSANQKRRTTSEGRIAWTESQDDAMMGSINGVNFIFDHGGNDSNLQPVILSEDGFSAEIPVPSRLIKSAFAAAGLANGDAKPFTKWLGESVEQLRPITDEESDAINEAMARIKTSADGGFEIELSGDIDVDMGGVDDEAEEMKPVDSLDTAKQLDAPDEDSDDDSMPDFESGKEDEDEDEEVEVEESEESDEEESEEEEQEEEKDEEGLAEDADITAPNQKGYRDLATGDKRKAPEHKLNQKKSGNKLEGLGPELKKDSGSGSNPPVARKGGSK